MTKTQVSSTASMQEVGHKIRIYVPFHQMPPPHVSILAKTERFSRFGKNKISNGTKYQKSQGISTQRGDQETVEPRGQGSSLHLTLILARTPHLMTAATTVAIFSYIFHYFTEKQMF